MRRLLIASILLVCAGCAGNAGTASLQAALPSAGGGAHYDVVQRGDGASQGFTFSLPPSSYSPRSGIVRGYDDEMWFGTFEQIGRISEHGKIALYTQGTQYPFLSGGISRGPQGDRNVWFTKEQESGGAAAVDRVSTPTGETTEFAMPEGVDVLWGIAAGPDRALYAASYGSNMIVRIPTSGTPVTEYPLSGPVSGPPLNIVLGADGAMWFTMAGGNSIGRFDPKTHAFSYYPIPTSDAGPIAAFAGAIYFVAGYDNQTEYVGKMTLTGQVSKIELPAWNGKPRVQAICEGPDGNLWAGGYGFLWTILPDGTVSGPRQLPGIVSGPTFIAAGADGNLWFLNDQPASVSVYLLHVLSASTTNLRLKLGQNSPLMVTESSPEGQLEAKSLSNAVATVTSNAPGSFVVTAVGVGNTKIRVSDAQHNFVDIAISSSR